MSRAVFKAVRKTDKSELEVELHYFYFNGKYMPYYSRVDHPRSCYMPDDLEIGKMIRCEGDFKRIVQLLKKEAHEARLAILEESLGSWYMSAIQSGFSKETIQGLLQKKIDSLDNDYEKGED